MDRKFFFALAAFGFLLLYLFLVWSVLAPLFRALLWAAFLTIASYPPYRQLRRRLEDEGRAASLMTSAVVLLIALPVGTLLFLLAVEVDKIFEHLQVRLAAGNLPLLEGGSLPGAETFGQYLLPILQQFDLDLQQTLAPAMQNLASTVVEKLQALIGRSAVMVLELFVMAVALFFFYRDGERLIALFWSAVPLPKGEKKELGVKTHNVLMAVIYGVFLTAGIQGVLGLLGYWIAGLPSPVLLGALTALAALIPMAGTALVWLPGGIYLLLAGRLWQGVFLLAWGAAVIATSDNFIRPYFISGRGQVPFLAVLIGILGGLATFGFIGIVAGPVILALFMPLLDIFRRLLPPRETGTPDIREG